MKRRLCSYDMLAVPDPCYLLKDDVGDMYFCNLRCFAIWAVQRATRPDLSGEEQSAIFTLTTVKGQEHKFTGVVSVAKWATAEALRGSSF